MKLCLLMTVFLAPFVHARGIGGCGVFSFKGTPRIVGQKMLLIVNEGSNSEVLLQVLGADRVKMAPYLGTMTTGRLTISKVTGPASADVEGPTDLDYSVSDPLNMARNTFLVPINKRKCE